MADRADKRKRKEMLDQWKAQERAVARTGLPLSNEQLHALFDMLDVELSNQECDHTLRLVRRWLEQRGLAAGPVEAWLRENGGYCDCEASANAEQKWQDAIHDVDW